MTGNELPLLHDHHSHVSLYAALSDRPDLSGLDKPEALALLRSLPKDSLSMVLGWYSARLDLAEDELASLPPAVIANYSLHGVLLTPGARELLKDSDPELVARHQDPEWCERNLAALLAVYVRSAGLTQEKLGAFMRRMESLGLGSLEDMAVTDERAVQVIRSSPWGGRVRLWADPGTYQKLSKEARDGVTGLKLFADGALGLRTASMEEAYMGGGKGLLVHKDSELLEKVLASRGLPLSIHALGSRAVEQVLRVLELLAKDGARLPAVRLEHVQFMDEAQARRARSLGLTLSMQPNFSADSRDYADRLSPAARAANNPLRMLIDRVGFVPGKDLVFGSDGMPHGADAALRWALFPDFEGQRLSLDELVAGYGPALEGGGTFRVRIDEVRRYVELVGTEG
jgi:predicted amidohydrolase YtcJ